MSRTKKLLSLMLAVLLAVIVMVMPTAQVIAKAQTASGENADSNEPGKYISEVRVGLGMSKSAAAASLAGYTILTDDKGEYADLNEGAESKSIIGSKGAKVVLLGYKTTNDPADAITDLAVMNMDGGYSVKDYEALMDKYRNTQIKPIVTGILYAVKEYRENYNSSVSANKEKAIYAHDMLNKLFDDDTGMLIGDLLLKETKQEMEAAERGSYDALTDAEKKKHADLEAIIIQANGQATLAIENLLTRASDTSDTNWIKRFVDYDIDALSSQLFPDMNPTDSESMISNLFDNDARKILTQWNDLLCDLEDYDNAKAYINGFDTASYEKLEKEVNAVDLDTCTEEEAVEVGLKILEMNTMHLEYLTNQEKVAVHDYLESVEYFDGFTMLDFFSQPSSDIEADISMIYPMVAALSPGQRGGIEFISLKELILMCTATADQYAGMERDLKENASIYEGVDREIYEKGGVALTSDALRKDAALKDSEYDPFSTLTTVMQWITVASATITAATWAAAGGLKLYSKFALSQVKPTQFATKTIIIRGKVSTSQIPILDHRSAAYRVASQDAGNRSAFCSKLATGMTIALVIITAITVYLSWRDLADYYDTDFSPIPNYMVEEADITRKNEKGEIYVIKNQTAYYKAVLCNRTEKDEKFSEIGDKADLNGDVGRKWVALYSVKNAAQYPILADSFKVVTGSSNVPLDYSNGIHKFGSGAAFDMNNTYYAWNHGKGGIYVYYKVDDTVPPREGAVTGTIQTAGTLAAVGGGGLIVGFLAGSLIMNKRGKKEEDKTEEAA